MGEALSGWGDDLGSVVVISHDKSFCDQVGFTHVATVQDGRLTLEQRDARASDWDSSVATVQRTTETVTDTNGATETASSTSSSPPKDLDPETRKKLYNAPRRITKIEELVEKKEGKMVELEEEMLSHGSDVGKLVDLTNQKNKLEEETTKLMAEWEELEALVAEYS